MEGTPIGQNTPIEQNVPMSQNMYMGQNMPMGQELSQQYMPQQMPGQDMWNQECVRQGRKFFSHLGLMYFCGTLVIYGVQLLVMWVLSLIEPGIFKDANFSLLASMLPMYLVGMPIMVVLIQTVPAQQLPQRSLSVGKWVLAMIMCYAILYCSNLVGVFITFFIGLLKGGRVANNIQDITTSVNPIITAVFMVVCAPLYEEFIFRKLLVDRVVRYGESIAVVLSGLVFGLFHGNLSQFAYASTLGMFLAFIYVKTGRLRYTIFMHMMVNFMGGVIAPFILKFIDVDAMNKVLLAGSEEAASEALAQVLPGLILMLGYLCCILGITVAGIVLLIVFHKKFKATPKGIALPKGKRFTTVILNVGMVLFILFWVFMIIWQLFQ
ncbi:MAG: CPBP family intramembrane metalloprotease [Lachnospiraceae bacterium]|nr:CPBP family intramembrane metalloprotease [Lachnospiraceae bacterium]